MVTDKLRASKTRHPRHPLPKQELKRKEARVRRHLNSGLCMHIQPSDKCDSIVTRAISRHYTTQSVAHKTTELPYHPIPTADMGSANSIAQLSFPYVAAGQPMMWGSNDPSLLPSWAAMIPPWALNAYTISVESGTALWPSSWPCASLEHSISAVWPSIWPTSLSECTNGSEWLYAFNSIVQNASWPSTWPCASSKYSIAALWPSS